MKVRVTLVNGRTYVGELRGMGSGLIDIETTKGKMIYFPDHSVLMVEEI